jgi:hypothetical protein
VSQSSLNSNVVNPHGLESVLILTHAVNLNTGHRTKMRVALSFTDTLPTFHRKKSLSFFTVDTEMQVMSLRSPRRSMNPEKTRSNICKNSDYE